MTDARPFHTHIDNDLSTFNTIASACLISLQAASLTDVLRMSEGFKISADVEIILFLLFLFSLPLSSSMYISLMTTDGHMANYEAFATTDSDGVNEDDYDEQNMG